MKSLRTSSRILAILAMTAAIAAADARVYVTERGKTYHQARSCMALSRATKVYDVAASDAEAHGLKRCGICGRAKKAKPDTSGWMKGGK